MRKPFLLIVSAAIIFIYAISTVSAGGPVFWKINTRADVEKGDIEGLSIADNGTMTLAPTLSEVFDTKQAYIWSAASDTAGNIYLGTGHEGRIFKVDATGRGALLYKSPELDVMALAVDARGNVYAGTSPDGKVYRITPQGQAGVFFEPKTKYIWSLAFDRQGRLLVGTGDKGEIYRVNPDGSGALLFKTTQTNITALSIDAAGNVIAGTDPGGLVVRISPDGRAFTLFDSQLREVRDMAIGSRGEIYALTLAESAGGGGTNAAPAASTATPTILSAEDGVTITISDLQTVDTPSSGSTSSAGSVSNKQLKSALYRIDPSGVSDLLWSSNETVAFSISPASDGTVRIGTGEKGRIFEVAEGRNPLLLAQSPEGQTSRFVRAGGNLYAASSNLGKLFRVGEGAGASGSYTSPIRDAQTTAAWGRISWLGEGAIEIQTRSGNTARPDSTWSDWSAAITASEGGAIISPPARFLQWRAMLKRSGSGTTPRLREVTISYLPRNLSPAVTSLKILPVGTALQALPQVQADGISDQTGAEGVSVAIPVLPPRRLFQRGAISLQWQAEDRNNDTLSYSIFYRQAAGGDFFPLKTDFRETYFTIEPNALPDGRYVFKVVASDNPSNPDHLALACDQETESIEIDNTPPNVAAGAPKIAGENAEITFQAHDATSFIRKAEYQLDGGDWKSIYPADGIADSLREDFTVKAKLIDAKPHIIAIRVYDANSNVGSAQATVRKQ